jgi:hypothetical protein
MPDKAAFSIRSAIVSVVLFMIGQTVLGGTFDGTPDGR